MKSSSLLGPLVLIAAAVAPSQVATKVEIVGLSPADRQAFADIVKKKCGGKF